MSRERIVTFILRSYPPTVRGDRGREMLGTLLDVSEESAGTFVRECASLGLGGMRERARQAAPRTTGQLITAFRHAATLWIIIGLVGISGDALSYPAGIHGLVLWLLLLWPVLVVALLGYERLAGACGVAWVATVQLPIAFGPYPIVLASSLVPLVGFATMIVAPAHRTHDPRRLLWLLPVGAISMTGVPHPPGDGSGEAIVILATVSIGALCALPITPTLAMASALIWGSIGLAGAQYAVNFARPATSAVVLIAIAPITIFIMLAQRRRIRRHPH
jgi:hypothetical protein